MTAYIFFYKLKDGYALSLDPPYKPNGVKGSLATRIDLPYEFHSDQDPILQHDNHTIQHVQGQFVVCFTSKEDIHLAEDQVLVEVDIDNPKCMILIGNRVWVSDCNLRLVES